jgi:hypothetical protein
VEAFESVVAVALEAEGFVVSEAVKFPVRIKTAKQAYDEYQTHGFEVDLVGARADRLVLATVKSFLGSRGVAADHVTGEATSAVKRKRYALLNDTEVRSKVVTEAAKRYGYPKRQIELRLYAGRFAAPQTGTHRAAIEEWARRQRIAGGIRVFGLDQIVDQLRSAASHKQYRDNPVLVTLKVLEAAGQLAPRPS